MTPKAIIKALQREITDQTRELSDEDYVDVMEQLSEFCADAAAAKREELEAEDKD